jgi:hypothetical protein
MSQSFVPLRGARVENGNVVVDFDKTTVKDAPRIDDDGSLSPAEEDQLYAYYGMGTTNIDTADYGTADQTPDPGFARADGSGDRLGSRTDALRGEVSTGGRDLRSGDWGDRPDGTEERIAAAGSASDRDDVAREGSGGYGAVGDAGDTGDDKTTSDAPPADEHRDWLDKTRDRDAAPTEDATSSSGGGRLRKWVMTEYEPVKTEEVYVEGQGHPGERPTR